MYEVVIFTASIGRYASPLLDKIDPENKCPWRLYRDACLCWQGSYIKDLSKLGRDLRNVLIIDVRLPLLFFNLPLPELSNKQLAATRQRNTNSELVRLYTRRKKFLRFDDEEDRELYELMPILKALAQVDDIQAVMRRTALYDEDE